MRVPQKHQAIRRTHISVPELREQLDASRQEFNRVGTDFLRADVATALAFTEEALTTDDPFQKRRNQRSARKAYDTILKLSARVKFTKEEAQEMKANLKRLRSNLVSLGEIF
jgi:hypothetical protein